MARGFVIMLLVLTVGCVAPPLVVSTRGEVTTGPEVEELIRTAGVCQVTAPFVEDGNGGLVGKSGNGIWVEENRLLSVAHLAVSGPTFLIEGSFAQATTVCKGTSPQDDWALLETDLSEPPAPCRFPIADAVAPGQEILVVGYLVDENGTKATAVAGRVVDPGIVFRREAEDRGLVCTDLGSRTWPSLSGSAVLTKDADGAWRLAGVQEGWLETDRGEIVSTFVPLSRLPLDCASRMLAIGR